jgi:hypothetical protein
LASVNAVLLSIRRSQNQERRADLRTSIYAQTRRAKVGKWRYNEWMQTRAIAAAVVLLSTVAARSADAKNACGEAAIADFRARLALMQQESPVLPVEATIAVRRLEEEFCLRFVRCDRAKRNHGFVF